MIVYATCQNECYLFQLNTALDSGNLGSSGDGHYMANDEGPYFLH